MLSSKIQYGKRSAEARYVAHAVISHLTWKVARNEVLHVSSMGISSQHLWFQCGKKGFFPSGWRLTLQSKEPACMRGVSCQPWASFYLCSSLVISPGNWRFPETCVLSFWLSAWDIKGLLHTGRAEVLLRGKALGTCGSSAVASNVHFQEVEPGLRLTAHLSWPAQRREEKG